MRIEDPSRLIVVLLGTHLLVFIALCAWAGIDDIRQRPWASAWSAGH